MSRVWRVGLPVRVQMHHEQPTTFFWQNRSHRIVRLISRWRVEVGWWRFPMSRDFYQVQTADGALAVLYRDAVAGGWFLQRVYD